jgi:hypothetical protein
MFTSSLRIGSGIWIQLTFLGAGSGRFIASGALVHGDAGVFSSRRREPALRRPVLLLADYAAYIAAQDSLSAVTRSRRFALVYCHKVP